MTEQVKVSFHFEFNHVGLTSDLEDNASKEYVILGAYLGIDERGCWVAVGGAAI